jgi:hypothetical protein
MGQQEYWRQFCGRRVPVGEGSDAPSTALPLLFVGYWAGGGGGGPAGYLLHLLLHTLPLRPAALERPVKEDIEFPSISVIIVLWLKKAFTVTVTGTFRPKVTWKSTDLDNLFSSKIQGSAFGPEQYFRIRF